MSCKALQEYIKKVQDDADRELKEWQDKIEARELAEKRRVAPGWLDSDARILEPERVKSHPAAQNTTPAAQPNIMDVDASSAKVSSLQNSSAYGANEAGDELDRAFGGLGVS